MISIKLDNQGIFDIILESVNRVYEKAEEKNIQVELEAQEEEKGMLIPHDRKWLCEAIINILENAVKYRAIGATKRQIRAIVIREGMTLAFIGIPIGSLLGSIMAEISFAWIMHLTETLHHGMETMILSFILSRNVRKESLVERIRYQE